MNKDASEEAFAPSMHIIPLDRENNSPVIVAVEGQSGSTLVGVTDNGRISFFPIEAKAVYIDDERIGKAFPLLQDISDRIKERFPHGEDMHGNRVNQFVAVGVMYGSKGQDARFIFEVWGFLDGLAELDAIYSKLSCLRGIAVGGAEYRKVEEYLCSTPVSNWVNQLIAFLKAQLGWSNYVREALDDHV